MKAKTRQFGSSKLSFFYKMEIVSRLYIKYTIFTLL
jgi:hypothetical protein